MTYPLTLTEIPHQGKSNTWTLEGDDHLRRCIEHAQSRGNYDAWCEDAGYEGEGVYTLDAYLDWLRHDLHNLIVHDDQR